MFYGVVAIAGPVLGNDVAAAIIVLLSFVLTRGLHLDGLVDVADAYMGARSREDILRILKDTHIGAFGAAAMAVSLILKFAGASLLVSTGLASAFIYGAVASRVVLMLTVAFFKYVRTNGVGSPMQGASKLFAALSALISIKIGVLYGLFDPSFLLVGIASIFCIAAGVLFAQFLQHRIGGTTGDIYGAVTEVSETLLFVVLGVVISYGS